MPFNFRLDDLDDRSKIAQRIMGGMPPLKTTFSQQSPTGRDRQDVTLFTQSQILMGLPGKRTTAEQIALQQGGILASLSPLIGLASNIPGLGDTIPEFLQDLIGITGSASQSTFSPLTADGKIPPFEGKYLPVHDEWIAKALSLANAEDSYVEEPSGSGVTKFAKNVGLGTSSRPWSAIFLMSIFRDANIEQKGLIKTDVSATFKAYEDVGRVGERALVGSLAFMDYTGGQSFFSALSNSVSHVGLVTKVEDGVIHTIEGNVSLASNPIRSGVGVYAKKHRPKDIIAYAYPVYPDGEVVAFPPDPPPRVQQVSTSTAGDIANDGDLQIGSGKQFSWYSAVSAKGDSGGEQPGARALMDSVVNRYKDEDPHPDDIYGIYDYRPIRGGSSLSIHSEGRALDIRVPETDAGKRLGNRIFSLLAYRAQALGLQRIVWYRMIWDTKTPDGREYKGEHPHKDHLHVEMIPSAAQRLTRTEIDQILSQPAGASVVSNPYT